MTEHNINSGTGSENLGINIKEEVYKYLRFWKWFLLSVTLCVIAAFIYLRYTPENYMSFAKIKILDESKGLELSTERGGLFSDSKNLDNEIEVIRSKRLLEKVVDSLDLHIRYFFEGKLKQEEIWQPPFIFTSTLADKAVRSGVYMVDVRPDGLQISIGEDESTSFFVKGYTLQQPKADFPFLITSTDAIKKYIGFTFRVKIQSIASAASSLSYQVGINKVGATDILQLTLVGENRQRSEAILNKVIEQFNQDGVEDRQLVHQRTIDFVDDRFVFLAEELDSIEVNKKEFQQENNLVSFGTDVGYSMGKRSTSEQAVMDLENQIALANLLKAPLTDDSGYALLPENIGLSSGNVNGIVGAYNKIILDRERLIASAGESNPSVLALEEQLQHVKGNLKRSLAAYYEQLNVSLKRLKVQENEALGLVKHMPTKEKILRSIERQQNLKENLYLLLLQRREEAAINMAITLPSIKVVEYAASSGLAVSPNPKSIYMKSILAGLLIPLGIIFLLFKLDTKIHDKSDVVDLAPRIPIAGEIPKLLGDQKLFSDPHDRTMLAESFRILSTNLNYVLPSKSDDQGAQIIYITSSIKGEGKTFISVNLALAFSSLNRKVLLIGADLRNPKITLAKGDKTAQGLSDYLYNGTKDWKDYLQHSKYNKAFLDVLTAGTIPPNPTELLSNGKLETLLEEAKNSYHYIIIDTAPLVPVTDTLLISKHADVTVYVTRAGYTEKKLLGFSRELFTQQKLNNMVYVVNDISEAKSSRGYGYNYGYGYGYNNDTVVKRFSKTWFKNVFFSRNA